MAYNKLAFGLFAILLSVTAITVSNAGIIYKGVTVIGLKVHGRAVCSLSSNPPSTTPGIAGVGVDIIRDGATTSLAHAITNPDGTFIALVTNLDGLAFDQSTLPCFAVIQLPAGISCTVFPPKATISARVSLVGTITQDAIGLVAEATVSAFAVVH